MNTPPAAPAASPRLKRRLGLATVTLLGVGAIIGAGIYVIIGVAAGEAGNAVWLSFLLAAAGAALTGFSYARLARLQPKNAPEYQYLGLAFGPLPGFLAGWLVLWVAVISTAVVALGFAGYLNHLAGVPVALGALALTTLSALIVYIGIGESSRVAVILTLVEALGLVLVIAIGLPRLGDFDLLQAPSLGGVAQAASLVFFAYLGFEGMANYAEEMKAPARDLPRAILLAIAASTVLYVLVALAAVSAIGAEALASSQAPLATVATRTLGAGASLVLSYIALASTANTVMLFLLTASRALWAMSCAGALPGAFCVIDARRRTPWVAIITVAAFIAVFVLVGDLAQIASFTNFAILLAFVGVNASAIKLLRQPGGRGPRRVLLDVALPVLAIVVSLVLAASAGWLAAVLGAGLLLLGLAVYAALGWWRRRAGLK